MTDTITQTDEQFEAGYVPADEGAMDLVMTEPSNGKVTKGKKPENIKAYKPKEAAAADEALRVGMGQNHVRLWIFKQRKGYNAMGFETFDAYVEASNFIDVLPRQAYRWCEAVQTTVDGLGKTVADMEAMITAGESIQILAGSTAKIITALPTPELRSEAVHTLHSIMQEGVEPSRAQNKDAKNIVRQIAKREDIKIEKATMPPRQPIQNKEKPAPPVATNKEPMTLTEVQFADGEEALNTFLTFVQNRHVLCDNKECRLMIASVQEICKWVESHL